MRRMKGLLYLVLGLAGCAMAGRENVPGGGDMVGGRPDGGGGGGGGGGDDAGIDAPPPPDAAPLPDAPPGMQLVTLSQTNDMTMAPGKAVACGSSDPFFGIPIATRDNSWYRVFKLSDYGITGPFNVQRVTFWVDYASSGTGTTQPATVKIGTYSGTLDADTLAPGSITYLATQPTTIPDANSENGVDPPVETNISATVPAGSNLLVEVALPDGYQDEHFFYIGVSAGGEQKKGYIRATPSGCNMTTPKSLVSPTALNRPDNAVMITVTGTK